MRTIDRFFSLALVIVVSGTFPAIAVAAPKAKKPPAEISIENGRKVALKSFEIAFVEPESKPGRKARPPRKPVLRLEEPLVPGDTKVVKLSGAKGCSYIARWTFDDVGDEGPIDICGDPKIVLTD